MFRKIILLIFFVGAIIIIVSNIDFSNLNRNNSTDDKLLPDSTNEQVYIDRSPERFCYLRENITSSGFSDLTLLSMFVSDNFVDGELLNLPAETDSKVGQFSGEIIQEGEDRRVFAFWDSFSEGMRIKEELIIKLNNDSAHIGFGEMQDRGDGAWVYADVNNINFSLAMPLIDCERFDDRVLVDRFIRQNISTLAPEDPVLGGNFYVVSVSLDYLDRSGEFVYEDGHIQGRASFNYVRFGEEVLINNILKIN